MKITEDMKELTRLLDESDAKSDCYYIGNYALIYEDICKETIESNIKLLHDMKSKGMNVTEILDYSYDEEAEPKALGSVTSQRGWVLHERAKGNQIHHETNIVNVTKDDSYSDTIISYYTELRKYANEIALIAQAPLEQFETFIKDYYTLSEGSPLTVERNINKIFYDPNKGFSFAGLKINGQKPKHDTDAIKKILDILIYQPPVMVANYKGESRVIDDIPNEIYAGLSKNIEIILDKTIASLRKVPVRKTFIDNDIDLYCDVHSKLIRNGGISQDDLITKMGDVFKELEEVYANNVKS